MMTVHNNDQRGAFTLVELLVVTLIIGLLASVVLFALAASQERAREARTRSQISKIDQLISTRWQSYLTRRVPISTIGMIRILAAQTRLNGIRELMRMEIPDRITDVIDDSVSGIQRPALSWAYLRRANALPGGNSDWSTSHQGAECLYMILALIQDGETNGLEFFHQTEIGDVDEDGMPEILDGWGRPIEFLRWAPGFRSVKQDGDATNNPDPFDPMRVYSGTFLLFPLVFSAGPDELYDITTNDTPDAVRYAQTTPENDPYFTPASGDFLGTPKDANNDGVDSYIDNIHNHLTDTVLH